MTAEGEFLPLNGCLSIPDQHLAPVRFARQGAGQGASHFLLVQPGLGHFRGSLGQVQPKERRTGPRQRSMEGCLRSVRSRKNALDFCKGGMLGKDDPFKVVLDPATDPGADKRGLLWSGPVLTQGEDTGGACSLLASRDCSRKGAGIGAAQLT